MKITTIQERIFRDILADQTDNFRKLAKIAGLDPTLHFKNADLRGINFGLDDLSGFDFSGADLSLADLSRVRGLEHAMFHGAKTDGTNWPPTFQPHAAGQEKNSKDDISVTQTDQPNAPVFDWGVESRSDDFLRLSLRANQLVENIKNKSIHPVPIFGSVLSGKSVFLRRLLNHSTDSNASVRLNLGSPIRPENENEGYFVYEHLRYLTERWWTEPSNFTHDTLPAATQVSEPLLIPVDLTTRSEDEEEYHLAFSEGNGEWYEYEYGTPDKILRPFPADIYAILTAYSAHFGNFRRSCVYACVYGRRWFSTGL